MTRYISLGPTCETRWQLNRLLNVGPPGDVFDYQITPFSALIEWLRRDFQGVFELEDLRLAPPRSCIHAALKTEHPHAFHPAGENMTDAEMVALYPETRAAFEQRAQHFRDLRESIEPLIFLRREAISLTQRKMLLSLLPKGRLISFSDEAAGNPTDWRGRNAAWDTAWPHFQAMAFT